MRSPVLALSWQLWYRHRWCFAIVGAYLLGCAALVAVQPFGALDFRDGSLLSILFCFGLIYVAAAFAYGFETAVEARESGFPARLFVLPVRTRALVGWPMLQGALAVALLWAAWCEF